MRRQTLWVFVLSVWIGLSVQPIFAQSTPTPEPVRSIFDYDTCAPPCWLDLIPGQSTPADVEAVLQSHPDLIPPESIDVIIKRLSDGTFDIDSETGLMHTGGYFFDIGLVEQVPGGVSSRIEIQEGKIDIIVILAQDGISLSEVLERLGAPDITYFYVHPDTDRSRFALIYEDLLLWVNLVQPIEQCDMSNVLERMVLDSVLYYSPEAAVRPFKTDHDVPQPDLTGYRLLNDRLVPLEVWQTWIEGEVSLSCEDAWAQLPEPEIMPAIDLTAEPQP